MIGGLFTSTLLTLVLLPTLYAWLETRADALHDLKETEGFTFTRVGGHGPQDERDPALSARDRVVGYTPHVRVWVS